MSTLNKNNGKEKQCGKENGRQLTRRNEQSRVPNEDNSENIEHTQCSGTFGKSVQKWNSLAMVPMTQRGMKSKKYKKEGIYVINNDNEASLTTCATT